MTINPENADRLLKMIQLTREEELTCPQCLEELDRYVQRILDGTPLDELIDRVREHLEACPFCNEEFRLVLETLNAIKEP